MKKITLAIACFGLISLASCKKDRTCTCTETNQNGDATVTTYTLNKISSGDAKDFCSNTAETTVIGSNTSTNKRECKLN